MWADEIELVKRSEQLSSLKNKADDIQNLLDANGEDGIWSPAHDLLNEWAGAVATAWQRADESQVSVLASNVGDVNRLQKAIWGIVL